MASSGNKEMRTSKEYVEKRRWSSCSAKVADSMRNGNIQVTCRKLLWLGAISVAYITRQRIAYWCWTEIRRIFSDSVMWYCKAPSFSLLFISGEYNSAQDISTQLYWILRSEECVELYLHSTHLHVQGVMLKLRINIEFLNFNMTK